MVSSALLLVGVTQVALRGLPPVFRGSGQVAGFEWLAENAGPGAVVLSSFETGNALPAWSPSFVLIGHGPESAGLAVLEPRIRAFFASSGSGPENDALLREFDVSFVFVGPAERAMGFSEAKASSTLVEVYRQGEITIFRFDAGQPTDAAAPGSITHGGQILITSQPCEALASG
jgi:hypothetical protein